MIETWKCTKINDIFWQTDSSTLSQHNM